MSVILNNKDKLTDNYRELLGQCTLGGTRQKIRHRGLIF